MFLSLYMNKGVFYFSGRCYDYEQTPGRCREMSARGYALYSVCPQLSYSFPGE